MNKCNVENRTIFLHDNLEVLQNINAECIDLIYLDPPFNKNKTFAAPIGSSAEGAEFKDIFREEDVKDEWLQTISEDHPELHNYLNGIKGVGKRYNFAYLAYMAIRLVECQRILKKTGSIYLHCDPTMSHYLKTTLDCVFREDKFQAEITWQRTSAHNDRVFGSVTDSILFYGNPPLDNPKNRLPLDQKYLDSHYRYEDSIGRWRSHDLTGPSTSESASGESWRGYDPASYGGRHWSLPKRGDYAKYIDEELAPGYLKIKGIHERLDFLDANGLIHWPKKERGFPNLKRYLIPNQGQLPTSLITDIPPLSKSAKETTGYPTQKPLALLERIIKASSNEGDMVLDPFCGCATTCIAAEKSDREWIGIDVSSKAYDLVKERLDKEVARPDELQGFGEEVHLTTKLPTRTDIGAAVGEIKHVYIISHQKWPGEYKVGIAKDVKERLSAYQTSDPDRAYKLEFSHETHLFRETEKHIHDTFENKHEWVTGDMEEIQRAIVKFSTS